MPALLISVRFHDGRYHGRPDWPPSPARLFQALVAGAGRGRGLDDADKRALAWMEGLDDAPLIAAPFHRAGRGFSNYVPNNDLDAVGGDPMRINEIRAPKIIRPILFDAETPILYLWRFAGAPAARAEAQRICGLAQRLYQLGRGVDMAWACGEILDDADAEARLADYEGAIYSPSGAGDGLALAVPAAGSLESLIARHQHQRFERVRSNRKQAQLFRQAPKPRFRQVAYDSPPARLLFDLIGEQAPASLIRIAELTERIRDAAAEKLAGALKGKAGEIGRCLIGRGADEADKARRVKIVPLPSIGHPHVSPAIRRVFVDVPAACPLRIDDLAWALSGLELIPARVNDETGEIDEQLTLTTATNRGMLRRYAIEGGAPRRLWRTVTPAALSASRRRVPPERRQEEAKDGKERAREERDAARSALDALRHAGMRAQVEGVRVQREPWRAKGERAEAFEPDKAELRQRFSKHRLWHVEIAFAEPQSGPLVIGDGRYLGLGLMEPVTDHYRDSFVFDILGPEYLRVGDEVPFLRSVRRALMALDRDHGGSGGVSRLFSGHENDGSPSRKNHVHSHVFLAACAAQGGRLARLYAFSPDKADRKAKMHPRARERFETVVSRLKSVRAAKFGSVELKIRPMAPAVDPVIRASRVWSSVTPYKPTRHAKSETEVESSIISDVKQECLRRGVPSPMVKVLDVSRGPRAGIKAELEISFSVAVEGPILLGRDSHFGLGLFRAVDAP